MKSGKDVLLRQYKQNTVMSTSKNRSRKTSNQESNKSKEWKQSDAELTTVSNRSIQGRTSKSSNRAAYRKACRKLPKGFEKTIIELEFSLEK